MIRMIFTNDQKSFEYAIFMMVGSYFKRAFAGSKGQEMSRLIQYLEQKLRDQYWMEESCEAFVRRELLPKLPKEIWKEEMKVSFIPLGESKVSEVRFQGETYILRVAGVRQKHSLHFLESELYKKSA